MELCSLKTVTGSLLRDWYEILSDEGEGCGSVWYGTSKDGTTRFCVVMGVVPPDQVPKDDLFGRLPVNIFWKVGIQGVNNVMQTDFNVDFTIPKNHESGDIEDTEERVVCGTEVLNGVESYKPPAGYKTWNEFASHVRQTASVVYMRWC